MPVDNYIQQVNAFVSKQALWTDNHHLLLGVSGGMDSMVLAHYMLATKIKFAVAHVNFRLRAEDADEDARFVEAWCHKNHIPFFLHTEDTTAYAEKEKLSIEEAARDIRYRFFYHLSYAHAFHRIVTAHHANDNLETTLLHMVRGSGIQGMQGIPVRNHRVVRPFLQLTRTQLQQWADTSDIPFRTDKSNQDLRFTRNRLRQEVVPVLQQINPNLEQTFLKNNQLLQESAYLSTLSLRRIAARICRVSGNDIYISKNSLRNHPAAWSVLHHILSPYGFSSALCQQILSNMDGSGKWVESGQMRLLIDRKDLVLCSGQQGSFSHIVVGALDRLVKLPGISLEFRYSENLRIAESGLDTAYVDPDKLQYPLLIRPWQKGDYIYPAGLYKANGKPAKKKVSDLLVNEKKSLLEKERLFLLFSGEQLVWVIGLRQDERFLPTSGTSTLLKIKMHPIKGHIYY